MQTRPIKAIVAAGWIATVCVVGIAAGATYPTTWAILLGAGALPPIVLFWRWNDPAQTMSESIQEARR